MQETKIQPPESSLFPLSFPKLWSSFFRDTPHRQAIAVLKDAALHNISLEGWEARNTTFVQSMTIAGEAGSLKINFQIVDGHSQPRSIEHHRDGEVREFGATSADGKRIINKVRVSLQRLSNGYMLFAGQALRILASKHRAEFSTGREEQLTSLPTSIAQLAPKNISAGPHELRAHYTPGWSPPMQMAIEADMARDGYYRSEHSRGNFSPAFPSSIPHSQPSSLKLTLTCPLLVLIGKTGLNVKFTSVYNSFSN